MKNRTGTPCGLVKIKLLCHGTCVQVIIFYNYNMLLTDLVKTLNTGHNILMGWYLYLR